MTSFVYRLDATQPFGTDCPGYVAVDQPFAALRHAAPLLRHFGAVGYLKLLLASATPSRLLYFIAIDGRLACHGKVTLGHCSHYAIEPDAAVIGSIWSDEQHRGKGLATRSMQRAIDRLLERGIRRIYIDTQPNNVPMQRVIERCGFEQIMTL